MFYTIYKITNLVNNKIYIGAHKTSNLEDNYIGSGPLIVKAKEKYGIENFKKEIIHLLDTEEEMYLKEKEIVNEEFVSRKDTYNIKEGGNGGWSHIHKNKTLTKLFDDKDWVDNKYNKFKLTMYNKYGVDAFKTFLGKNHTEEAKRKIGEANSKHQFGEGNSQFGTMWIYNSELKESKKIKKDEIIPEGWLKGRKPRHLEIRNSQVNKKSLYGEKNSQFGKIWIYNLELKESKSISKAEFNDYEIRGWLKGRKMKF